MIGPPDSGPVIYGDSASSASSSLPGVSAYDPNGAEVQKLLASLTKIPAPVPPHVGKMARIFGAIGDALASRASVQSGGQPPPMGAFLSGVRQRQNQYLQGLNESNLANAQLGNQVKIGAFQDAARQAREVAVANARAQAAARMHSPKVTDKVELMNGEPHHVRRTFDPFTDELVRTVDFGTAPQGYQYITDDQGNVTQVPSSGAPISGPPMVGQVGQGQIGRKTGIKGKAADKPVKVDTPNGPVWADPNNPTAPSQPVLDETGNPVGGKQSLQATQAMSTLRDLAANYETMKSLYRSGHGYQVDPQTHQMVQLTGAPNPVDIKTPDGTAFTVHPRVDSQLGAFLKGEGAKHETLRDAMSQFPSNTNAVTHELLRAKIIPEMARPLSGSVRGVATLMDALKLATSSYATAPSTAEVSFAQGDALIQQAMKDLQQHFKTQTSDAGTLSSEFDKYLAKKKKKAP